MDAGYQHLLSVLWTFTPGWNVTVMTPHICRQLGPVLHSTAAEAHGLKTSLLEAFVQYHATQQRHFADLGLAACLGTSHLVCT